MGERWFPELTVGLDPDTNVIGWAVKSNRGPIRCGTIKLAEMGTHAQLLHALTEVEEITRQCGGDVGTVVIEMPFVGPNASSALKLAEAMGQAKMAAELTWPGARIERMQPSTWRKRAGISGRASKLEVAFHARALGWDPPDQHAADAALMAEAA